jgi:hypothetical protein
MGHVDGGVHALNHLVDVLGGVRSTLLRRESAIHHQGLASDIGAGIAG